MSKNRVEIDGSFGEGGGQILRTSLALSLITGKPFHLRNVRAGRDKPGLHAQHLMSVNAAAKIGNASVKGACLRSTDLVFEPGIVEAGDYRFAIGTAGATGLVLQTVYLPLALAGTESHLTIEGGTHVKASPCAHFLMWTWEAYLRSIGVQVEVKMDRAGFYPRGGGILRAHISPTSAILPFRGLTTASIQKVRICSAVAGLPATIGERMARQATPALEALGLEVGTRVETLPGGPGCMLGIELSTEPAPTFFFALGEKGKPAEMVAKEAVDEVITFLENLPLGVDEHSSDQLVLPLSLAKEPSEFRVSHVSSHLRTNLHTIQQFLDRAITCDENSGTVRLL